jgi:hypothetical protein
VYRGAVEVVVCNVAVCRFEGVVEVRSSVLGVGGVHGEESVLEDVAVAGVETMEEVGILFFLSELVGGAEASAKL